MNINENIQNSKQSSLILNWKYHCVIIELISEGIFREIPEIFTPRTECLWPYETRTVGGVLSDHRHALSRRRRTKNIQSIRTSYPENLRRNIYIVYINCMTEHYTMRTYLPELCPSCVCITCFLNSVRLA